MDNANDTELAMIENAILKKMGQLDIDIVNDSYRYESNKRVKLDDTKSIGSFLTYSVYGDSRLEAAQRLLDAIEKDEKEFAKLRAYYSMKGKDTKDIVLTKDLGKYTIVIKENKDEKSI